MYVGSRFQVSKLVHCTADEIAELLSLKHERCQSISLPISKVAKVSDLEDYIILCLVLTNLNPLQSSSAPPFVM